MTSYAQISSDPAVQAALAATYGPDTPADVNKIDPREGVFAEDHVPGGDVGPTIKAVPREAVHGPARWRPFLLPNEAFSSGFSLFLVPLSGLEPETR